MTDPSASSPPPQRSLLLERMLFFSDAVFAIVLTLLALDLRLPPATNDAHLFQGIAAAHDAISAFVQSFAMVGLFWIVHLITLRAVAQFDWWVAGANLVFLFAITLMPFAASLVSDYGDKGMAWRVYCGEMIFISVSQCGLIIASHRDEMRLIHREHHGRAWARVARSMTPGIAFAIGLAASYAGLPEANVCWLLVVPLILIARRIVPDPAAHPVQAAPAATVPPADSPLTAG
jgi:TMEM175 potassium channel family protein